MRSELEKDGVEGDKLVTKADSSLGQIKMLDEVTVCLENVLAGVEVGFCHSDKSRRASVGQTLIKNYRLKKSTSSWPTRMRTPRGWTRIPSWIGRLWAQWNQKKG